MCLNKVVLDLRDLLLSTVHAPPVSHRPEDPALELPSLGVRTHAHTHPSARRPGGGGSTWPPVTGSPPILLSLTPQVGAA